MIYDNDREKEDLNFVTSFRNKWCFFSSKEERLWHRAKWWSCWLRHHRKQGKLNPLWYIVQIQYCRDSKELRAFDYINRKKD
jgi:hypothetical protein